MKRHKNKILAVAAVLCLLTAMWFWGGVYAPSDGEGGKPAELRIKDYDNREVPEESRESPAETVPPAEEHNGNPGEQEKPAAPEEDPEQPENEAETPQEGAPPGEAEGQPVSGVADPGERPQPVDPQDMTVSQTEYTCTLTVRCDTILSNKENLDEEKLALVPDDGILFGEKTVTFYEGESVFHVLSREMKQAKIHMEFVSTPVYNASYIEGIGNLYEFDCGELSGWMYKVNGWFPNYGCSRYQLEDGDVIEWVYTCDLGRDVGNEFGRQEEAG